MEEFCELEEPRSKEMPPPTLDEHKIHIVRVAKGKRRFALLRGEKVIASRAVPDNVTERAQRANVMIVLKKLPISDPSKLRPLAEKVLETAMHFSHVVATPQGFTVEMQA